MTKPLTITQALKHNDTKLRTMRDRGTATLPLDVRAAYTDAKASTNVQRYAATYASFIAGTVKNPPAPSTHHLPVAAALSIRNEVRALLAGESPKLTRGSAPRPSKATPQVQVAAHSYDPEVLRDALEALVEKRRAQLAAAEAQMREAVDLAAAVRQRFPMEQTAPRMAAAS